MKPTRREFIKYSTAALLGAILAKNPALADRIEKIISKPPAKQVPKRAMGKTGIDVSMIGFSGILLRHIDQEAADKVVADSIEAGVNYFDTANNYGDSEAKLGPALEPFRDEVFLATKTGQRSAQGAKEHLDRSLELLRTDHIDLYYLHAFGDVERDVKAALSKDGAIRTFLEARQAGVIRYIGFSAHSAEAALYAMENFDFDNILYPVNFTCHYQGNFDQEVLAMAREKQVNISAIKAMAKQRSNQFGQIWQTWYEPVVEPELAVKALSWTLFQPEVISAMPPGNETLYRLAVALAPQCRQLDQQQTNELKELSEQLSPIFRA